MRRMRELSLVTLAVLGMLAGCDSDSTTPQDSVPPLTEENAVFAAGYLAAYVADAYDVYQDAFKSAGQKEVSSESFVAGGISGSYTLDFRGADGVTPAAPGAAAWVRAYTSEGQGIEVRDEPADEVPIVVCTFDATAFPYDSTPGAESGTVNGGGTLRAGDYTTTFTADDLVLSTAEYPPSGALTYDAGEHHVTVTFDGTRFADLTVGTTQYTVDLDTGAVSESD